MKDENYFKNYIATIPDFPKKGIQFRDITPTLEDPDAFSAVIDAMTDIATQYTFDKVICADARGFLFGSVLAYRLHKGVVLARKPGKLPRPEHEYSYTLEYGTNTMATSINCIKPGERVLIVDDLLATGGSAIAMAELVKMSGGIPVAGVFYVELPDLHGREHFEKTVTGGCHCIISFEGE